MAIDDKAISDIFVNQKAAQSKARQLELLRRIDPMAVQRYEQTQVPTDTGPVTEGGLFTHKPQAPALTPSDVLKRNAANLEAAAMEDAARKRIISEVGLNDFVARKKATLRESMAGFGVPSNQVSEFRKAGKLVFENPGELIQAFFSDKQDDESPAESAKRQVFAATRKEFEDMGVVGIDLVNFLTSTFIKEPDIETEAGLGVRSTDSVPTNRKSLFQSISNMFNRGARRGN